VLGEELDSGDEDVGSGLFGLLSPPTGAIATRRGPRFG